MSITSTAPFALSVASRASPDGLTASDTRSGVLGSEPWIPEIVATTGLVVVLTSAVSITWICGTSDPLRSAT